MQVTKVHCLFEQSGTFKGEFIKLGVPAVDYDILDMFGQTDVECDLFHEIENAYMCKRSIFDNMRKNELLMAFFPCTYFSNNNLLFFNGKSHNFKKMTVMQRNAYIIEREKMRAAYYVKLLQLCSVVERRHLRLIIENPYKGNYLEQYFPYRPAIIDLNRRLKGDYFSKPTMFYFIGCSPTGLQSIQLDKMQRYVQRISYRHKEDRSMISPDYARNFICDHVLGIRQEHTQITLNFS